MRARSTTTFALLRVEASVEAKLRNSHIFEKHRDEFYIEPTWTSERLLQVEKFEGSIYDPACGAGRIVMAAKDAGYVAYGTDIVRRSAVATGVWDFLDNNLLQDNIICNPPFGEAHKFLDHALTVTRRKIAFLLPTVWMNGAKTGKRLETTPLARVYLLSPRPSMPPGDLVLAGFEPSNGRVDFAWYLWEIGYTGEPHIRWLRRND